MNSRRVPAPAVTTFVLSLALLLIFTPVTSHAVSFTGIADVDVHVEGVLVVEEQGVPISFDYSLSGTGEVSTFDPPIPGVPPGALIVDRVDFSVAGPGGGSGSGRVETFTIAPDLPPFSGSVEFSVVAPDFTLFMEGLDVHPTLLVDPIAGFAEFSATLGDFPGHTVIFGHNGPGQVIDVVATVSGTVTVPEGGVTLFLLTGCALLFARRWSRCPPRRTWRASAPSNPRGFSARAPANAIIG